MYKKILVAIDGSEPSMRALNEAVNLASLLRSELTILSVVTELKLPFSSQYGLWATESHEEIIRRVLESLDSSMLSIKQKHPDMKVETKIDEGRPAERIVKFAEEGDFNLIVIGRQGYGMIEGFVLGSVSNEVVNSSTKPVLIIK